MDGFIYIYICLYLYIKIFVYYSVFICLFKFFKGCRSLRAAAPAADPGKDSPWTESLQKFSDSPGGRVISRNG